MIASPCTGVCQYDDGTGWCLGCGRTREEITSWGQSSDAVRQQVWTQISKRVAQLGLPLQRPVWTEYDLREQADLRMRSRKGQWLVGLPGAVAEIPLEDGEVEFTDGALIGRSPSGRLRLRIDSRSRALTPVVASNGPYGGEFLDPVFFVVHRTRLRVPVFGLTEIGSDPEPIDQNAGGTLFDLGLGSPASRFMVRIEDKALIRVLRGHIGASLKELLRRVGSDLVAASPIRVVESAYARAEVMGPIVPSTSSSRPTGHTHLHPGAPLLGRETLPGWELPGTYAPVALWEPFKDPETRK